MTYQEALEYISTRPRFAPRQLKEGEEPFNLNAIRRLLSLLGDPQDGLRFIHVAGTNGKGSTVAFLSQILMESGLRVGIYTSPYLERFTERIRVGDQEIPEGTLGRLMDQIAEAEKIMKAKGEDLPSEFELVCAAAFLFFQEKRAEIVVLEVGLGGRLDATNVIRTPELALITPIGFDHMETLGNTLPKIAGEKAGIIKPGGDVLTAVQGNGVDEVFRAVCLKRGSRLHIAALPVRTSFPGPAGQRFDLPGLSGLEISLLGLYQVENASLAAQGAMLLREKGWPITEAAVRSGLKKARWPGRFELLRRAPDILIDGAHNADGAAALRRSLEAYYPGQKITFVAGVLADKEYPAMLEAVLPLADRFYTIAPPSPRALSAGDLAAYLREQGAVAVPCPSIEEAVQLAVEHAGESGTVCAFGSLYYIGRVRALLRY